LIVYFKVSDGIKAGLNHESTLLLYSNNSAQHSRIKMADTDAIAKTIAKDYV